jgi:hypothetical protein
MGHVDDGPDLHCDPPGPRRSNSGWRAVVIAGTSTGKW